MGLSRYTFSEEEVVVVEAGEGEDGEQEYAYADDFEAIDEDDYYGTGTQTQYYDRQTHVAEMTGMAPTYDNLLVFSNLLHRRWSIGQVVLEESADVDRLL